MIGSHIDTVPDGGAYDGIAGVVAGIEVARLLREAAIALPFALEVADFLAEEPSEFGLSCIGSRGMAGRLSAHDLERREPAGTCLADAIREVGGRPEALGAPLRERGSIRAYLELHIEQGRVLERSGVAIGIVTGIVGIRRYEVRIAGAAAHSGTTPMDERHDALAGAAELIIAVERLARAYARRGHFVGTVGKLSHTPNASNVIPGTATLTLELRALTDAVLDESELQLGSELGALRSAVDSRSAWLAFRAPRLWRWTQGSAERSNGPQHLPPSRRWRCRAEVGTTPVMSRRSRRRP